MWRLVMSTLSPARQEHAADRLLSTDDNAAADARDDDMASERARKEGGEGEVLHTPAGHAGCSAPPAGHAAATGGGAECSGSGSGH